MNKTKPSKLLDANTAVESYLDNLLQEATEPENFKSQKVEAKNHNIHVLETPLTTAKQLTIEDVTEIKIEEVVDDFELESKVSDDEPVNYRQQFEYPLQCLMFKVKEHLLAIPLVQMGSVVEFVDRLTQLPHSPDYFKGLLQYRESTVRVADTASLLLNMQQVSEGNGQFSPSHLLVFKNEDWAISCDEILDVVTLNEDDIKWHSDENRLSFGTIKSSLALVVNPDAIIKKLISTDAE